MALQGLTRQLFAVLFGLQQQWIAIVLQSRRELCGEAAFQQQAWALEVIVTARDGAGTGVEAHGQVVDHRVFGNHAAINPKDCRTQFACEHRAVAEHQQVPVERMLVVPGNTLFGAQALNEQKVAFAVLRAVLTRLTGGDIEREVIGLDAMPFEHLRDDLRHGQLLENPLVVAQLQIMQRRYQCQFITGQALA